jgi:hypothetical protein
MANKSKSDKLAMDIHKTIEKHAGRENITLSEALGVLELVKADLIESYTREEG